MSSSFSANQYDSAFKSNKLQNWTVPKQYKEKPSPAEGHTIFIATDRGHLLPGVKRGYPWTSFQGTWDLPSHIPPVHINPTARSQEGQQRLRKWGQVQNLVPSASGKLNETNENSRTPQCEMDPDWKGPYHKPVKLSLDQQLSKAKLSLDQQLSKAKLSLDQQLSKAKLSLDQQLSKAKLSLDQQLSKAKFSLDQQLSKAKFSLDQQLSKAMLSHNQPLHKARPSPDH
ncbi:protein Flattop isoform X3 [Ictalurus punctatus]|uniref:Protein Flattop n=1 Tax=Ictalurus punctatus TaxID=7998 RepID=A0A2D0SLF7_ICTPU|nr:protein Flattop isoform X3 [Ictalurus punctatus]